MTAAWDWVLDGLRVARWRIQTVAVLILWWHMGAVQSAYSHGFGEGSRRSRRVSQAEARQRSRTRAFRDGYRAGRRDSRALRIVANNPAPEQLYRGKHERAS